MAADNQKLAAAAGHGSRCVRGDQALAALNRAAMPRKMQGATSLHGVEHGMKASLRHERQQKLKKAKALALGAH